MQNCNSKYHIVYASDDKFSEILGVSIASLLKNNSAMEIVIYILDGGIKQENKSRIESLLQNYKNKSIVWIPSINIEDVIGREVKQDRGSISQFARLFISTLLPKEVSRVLYLDCDVIIEQSIDKLWNIDLEKNTIAALLDPFSVLYRKNLGIDKNATLFNSGVMLIDLVSWKQRKIEERLLKLIKEYGGKIPQGDQGALCAILHNDVKLLDPQFNLITMFYDFNYDNMMIYRKPPYYYSEKVIEDSKADPVIVHFTTSFLSKRPWIEGSNHPYSFKWIEYRQLTPWKDKPLKKNNVKKYQTLYEKMYRVMPSVVALRISSFLQAYVRPVYIKYKYKIEWK